ncbi:MAG: aldehyde dehydrogenase family protein [Alphaproteobacteria bacterium]|jgi:acyl-CoA reductase-like NAD-dependent aldehyde dehydrogenase|nr:aldehyde dehydrogenase family protein [Alphaproteobacteria bacterium]MDP6817202.1 aldehyde dehydrogenase family protein [Alphaproteobacteria bacterium]
MAAFDPFARQIFIGNDYVGVDGANAIDVINPATLEPVGRIADCDADRLDEVVQQARAAQGEWGGFDATSRAAALHDVAHSIASADPAPVCELMTREVGKPYPESVGELANVAPAFHYFAEIARDDAGRIAGPIQPTTFQYERYDPYGVSVHITPYNYPLLILAMSVAASLAAGNAIIVKPSEISSLCTLAFMEHFKSLPPGVVSCVTGGGRAGAHLVESDGTDVVAFTGSVETGIKVNMSCAAKMKPCVIEAGGNDPLIVSDSIDLDFATAATTCAAFHLSGQICTSAERIFVVDGIHDAFVAKLSASAKALRVGDGFGKHEIGPLATEAARDRAARMVDAAIAAGAIAECGGRIPPDRNLGWYYEPTVLSGVTPDMEIMQNEIFGPVASVCRVGDVDEGIALANQSRFGLGASILTTRMDEAMRAAEKIDSGMVNVNNPLVDSNALHFGGRKYSGIGSLFGRAGLNSFRQIKMVTIDPKPILQDWWYPYPDDWFHSSSR